MKAIKTQDGLFTFPITLRFKNSTKTLKGLVDTGSNICICTYKIPVALRLAATSHGMIERPASSSYAALGYSLKVGFDDKSIMTHVYRMPLDIRDIDFILGMSVLSKCNVTMSDDHMEIKWR